MSIMIMEAFILGTSGMMPLPRRSLSSVLLRREGELLLFDCGEGTQVSLRRLNLRWKKISVIFVSHTHADHVTGIPGIMMLSSQVDREEPLTIIGPPKIKEYVEESRRILDMYINYPIIINEVLEPGLVYEGDGFHVKAFPLYHSKTCLGYTVEEAPRPGVFFPGKAEALEIPKGPLWGALQNGNNITLGNGKVITPEEVMGTPRPGRKFSYVTDTLYKPEISPNVKGADLLVCEAMFDKEHIADAADKKHLIAEQAAQIAREGQVRRMQMTHYSPRYTNFDLQKLEQEARTVFPASYLSKDRQMIPIPYPDEKME